MMNCGLRGALAALSLLAAAQPAFSSFDMRERPAWCRQVKLSADANPETAIARKLATLAEKAARRETITLVAIGSSSTEGSDLSDRSLAYPTHLEARLNAILGPGAVRVVNRGRGGERITDTVKRFAEDVAPMKPDLVVWQLGANDIVRSIDPDIVAHGVAEGMAQLEAIGAPVVLMDSQVAPAVAASPMLQPVQSVLKTAAERHGAMLWSRFALMQGILEAKLAEDSDLIKPDRLHMTVPMHVCTGVVLAEALAVHLVRASVAVAALPQQQRMPAARLDLVRNEY